MASFSWRGSKLWGLKWFLGATTRKINFRDYVYTFWDTILKFKKEDFCFYLNGGNCNRFEEKNLLKIVRSRLENDTNRIVV